MATENTFPDVWKSSPKRRIKKSRGSRVVTVKKCVMHEKVRRSVMHVQKFFSLKPFSTFLALSFFRRRG